MEARIVLPTLISITMLVSSINVSDASAQYRTGPQRAAPRGYRVSTEHFVVTAADANLAKKVGEEAERFRKELAIEWLGREIGPWQDKCPIDVEIGMHAGGETSFAFVTDGSGPGTPTSWRMKIFGPPDRLLDAVLPHEVTHTIFATHFGRPLPRWADEGACTTVEHESERKKNHQMLHDFLTAQPSRGIPFNRMFTMRSYPHDILPLYAQGYSLAKFLIMQKGRRYFLDYVGAGMNAESQGNELRAWDQATEKYYGYDDLSDLQIAWLQWVRKGSTELPDQRIAANEPIEPNQISRLDVPTPAPLMTPAAAPKVSATFTAATESSSAATSYEGSWYARQSNGDGSRVAANRKSLEAVGGSRDIEQAELYSMPKSDDARLDRWDVKPATIWR